MQHFLQQRDREAVQREAEGIVAAARGPGRCAIPLTGEEACQLVAQRDGHLRQLGRVELGGEVIAKLVSALGDSPYLPSTGYMDTLHELVRLFYYYRHELSLAVGDGDLIDYLCGAFNGSCRGSLELLEGRALDTLLRRQRGLDAPEDLGDSIEG